MGLGHEVPGISEDVSSSTIFCWEPAQSPVTAHISPIG